MNDIIVKYADGQEIKSGDHVLVDRAPGVVICIIDVNVESPWQFLERGVMVETEEMGLVHYPQPDEDLVLVRRTSQE